MNDAIQLIIQEQTFLGKIIGYRKADENKYKMYWALSTKQGMKFEFSTIEETNPKYTPSDVLERMMDEIFSMH